MLSCNGIGILNLFQSYNNAEVTIVGVTSIIITSKPRVPISGILTKNKITLKKNYTYM